MDCVNESRNELTDATAKKYVLDCIKVLKDANIMPASWGNDIELKTSDALHDFGSIKANNKNSTYAFTLSLSAYLLREKENIVKNTIYHELCHYIQMKQQFEKGVLWYDKRSGIPMRKRKDGRGYEASHGPRWKKIASAVSAVTGLEISRTGAMEEHPEMQKVLDKSIKYVIKCKKCGQEFPYSRRTEFVRVVQTGINERDWHCNCGSREFELIKGPKDE